MSEVEWDDIDFNSAPISSRKSVGFDPIIKPDSDEFPKDQPQVVGEEGTFLEEIHNMSDRITLHSFRRECKYWQDIFDGLPEYDENAMRGEVEAWELEIPGDKEWDIDILAAAYSLNQSYMTRIVHMIGLVNRHVSSYSMAKKDLIEQSGGLLKGSGGKVTDNDKKAYAAYVTGPLSRKISVSTAFRDYLVSIQDTLKHGANQMSRINKERDIELRYNSGLTERGKSLRFGATPEQKPTIRARSVIPPPVDDSDPDEDN